MRTRSHAARHRPRLTANDLGLRLASRQESELFGWFLASLLFGKPIQQGIARRAYETLKRNGITSLSALTSTSWDTLVALLDEAHYTRYDFSTATKLREIAGEIQREYGTVRKLLSRYTSDESLRNRLLGFNGIGPVTADIFLREVKPVYYPDPPVHSYETAAQAADILHHYGFAAYIIGGAVRDLWLDRHPKDFDLVTNATPDQLQALPEFADSKHPDTAQAYGVTRARFKYHDQPAELEIATFRRDLEAHRGRKATKVAFAELEDDVLRRDFTINALALDPSTGFITDYVDGIEDLTSGHIRFIGEPVRRIREDPLRIMRAIRFKNHLRFNYLPATILAIEAAVREGYIEAIATDRLRDELTQLLVHPSRRHAISDLDAFGILERVLPEVTAGKGIMQPPEFHAEGDVWHHELLILDYLPERPTPQLAWAALLHDIGKAPTQRQPMDPNERIRFDRHYAVGAEMAKALLQRLHFSRHDVRHITWIILNHMSIDDLPDMRPGHRQRMLNHPAFPDLLELHRADAAASWRADHSRHRKPHFPEIERLWRRHQLNARLRPGPSLKRDLGIDGHWLLDRLSDLLSVRDGPLIGYLLEELGSWYSDRGVRRPEAYERRARRLVHAYRETQPPRHHAEGKNRLVD